MTEAVIIYQWTGFYMITASVMKELKQKYLQSQPAYEETSVFFLTTQIKNWREKQRKESNVNPD